MCGLWHEASQIMPLSLTLREVVKHARNAIFHALVPHILVTNLHSDVAFEVMQPCGVQNEI